MNASEKPIDLLDVMAALRHEGRAFCLLTVVRTESVTSAKAGAKALITDEGRMIGHIGGGCVHGAAKRAAADALESGVAGLIRVKPKDAVESAADADGVPLHKSGCPSGGTVDIFVEPYREAPAIALCGAGPVASALARLGAGLGYRVLQTAAEEDLAGSTAERTAPGFDLESLGVGPNDFVVVVAQGKQDMAALRAAVESPAAYVSMVASRRKAGVLLERLAEAGAPADRLNRVKAPAGLDLGAIEPEEIALSILAEIVQRRRVRGTPERATGKLAAG